MSTLAITAGGSPNLPSRKSSPRPSFDRKRSAYRYLGLDAEFRGGVGIHLEVALGARGANNAIVVYEGFDIPPALHVIESDEVIGSQARTPHLNWRLALVVLFAFLVQAVVVIEAVGPRVVMVAAVPMAFAFFYVLSSETRKKMSEE